MSWKKSVLVIYKFLDLFVNTMTADDKYSFFNKYNLTQPIQIHLFKIQKTVSPFFYGNLKYRLNFEHFEIKDHPHS